MKYQKFKQIFDDTIFERAKADLLKKIAENPSRYIGLFRPTHPHAKLLQNLLQSHEIRFGDAFETAIGAYIEEFGYQTLSKRYQEADSSLLNIDQCFSSNTTLYFIEQKVRDDHDSTKKRGQIQNFEKKLNLLQNKHRGKKVVGIFYFIDPELVKNKRYYEQELSKMAQDYQVELHLFYGQDLFDYLNQSTTWQEIQTYLIQWKKDVPTLPQINFDLNPAETFAEIKDLEPVYYRKILNNDQIVQQILKIIFPTNATLKLLTEYFQQKETPVYRALSDKLRNLAE
ncbi:HpyAIV family type II restriction enzyme [Hugenholtzia roseola]|uniref:HpyAIV family type II restriction enzyme n=1 Tax=Hugenholtzia roseola TaxID=1002 RepID=UPI0004133E52|nr:hypothetical protein [Hugenholtzia roseola]